MPILKQENDIFPSDLLSNQALLEDAERQWWCVYTIARREKDFMRKLTALEIPHYGPVVSKRFRSPSGRLRTSFIPLFANYVFVFATDDQRYLSTTTNCISTSNLVDDRDQLVRDLSKIHAVVGSGVPLTPESRLEAGQQIRVKSGPFAGYEGTVLRREGKTRLLLSVKYLHQGVSMEMDEGLLEVV